MIAAFICREHGLTRKFSAQVFDEVNFQRQGKQYADQDAAIKILGSVNKRPLTGNMSPFLVFFEYGENR
jgi:predicted DCC family thiol-disulfide oxidoreductase YuxK